MIHQLLFLYFPDPRVAFWGTRSNDQTRSGRVEYELEQTDLFDDFDASSGRFDVPVTATYFTTFSSLAVRGEELEVYTTNTDPIVGIKSTTTNTGDVTFHSRDAIVNVIQGSSVYLDNEGLMESNAGQQISWASFNLDDAMKVNEYFFAGRTTPTDSSGGADLEYTNYWIQTSEAISQETHAYTCESSGVYYFMGSVGSNRQDIGVRVQGILIHSKDASDTNRETYQMKKLSTFHNGNEATSRAIVIECARGDRVYMYAQGANIYSDSAVQTSFGGFYYKPTHGREVAWAAYSTSQYDGRNNNEGRVVELDEVQVNVGQDFTDNEFVCDVPGTYLLHISAGLIAGQPLNMNLAKGRMVGGQSESFLTVIDLYHPDTTHADIISVSRTILITLERDDVLRLKTEGRSSYYSESASKETSFSGLLIYDE